MFFPRVMCCLIAPGEPDQYVSIREYPGTLTQAITHLGIDYRKTARKTDGGWRVYRKASA
jgi:hypothetical protein